LLPFVVLILAALMVSNFTYPATGIVNLWKKKPFFNLVAFILCGTMIYLQPELFLFLAFLGYVFFGIVGWKITALRSVENVGVERSEHETV